MLAALLSHFELLDPQVTKKWPSGIADALAKAIPGHLPHEFKLRFDSKGLEFYRALNLRDEDRVSIRARKGEAARQRSQSARDFELSKAHVSNDESDESGKSEEFGESDTAEDSDGFDDPEDEAIVLDSEGSDADFEIID